MAPEDGAILTAAQEAEVRATWGLVASDLKGNGAKFFIHLFRGYPQYQPMFKGFADIPLTTLAASKRLQAHGLTVFCALNALVENLDDVEVLTELLLKTGHNHGNRGVKLADFYNVKDSMLNFLASSLGDHWSPEARDAWDKVLAVMVKIIGHGLSASED